MPIDTVVLDALDGARLQADLVRVDDPIASVVLTHPHPLYGGGRHNAMVSALFELLPAAGFHAVRFDFRGVNGSTGSHDDGDSERLDVLAAIELLDDLEPGRPIWLVGYSFGSVVALNVVDPRVEGWVAIAPPLGASPPRCLADRDHRPKLLLSPRHDQFSPPDVTAAAVAHWTGTEVRAVESTDHFLAGHTAAIAADVTRWISTR